MDRSLALGLIAKLKGGSPSSDGYFVRMYDGTTIIGAEIVQSGDMPTFVPSKEGWTFNGWEDANGNPVTSITENEDLFADYTWNPNGSVKITGTGLKMTPSASFVSPLVYSIDEGLTWNQMTEAVEANEIYLRNGTGFAAGNLSYQPFTWAGTNIVAEGNMNACINYKKTLNNEEVTLPQYAFSRFFNGCAGLTTAPSLPATALAEYCYYSMFNGCTSLVSAPSLPATTLVVSCYQQMFIGCTSLVSAPELPATTLATFCYSSMFNGCTSLVSAPSLPATTLAHYCYDQMFYGCGKLATLPSLPATTLLSYCYQQMFRYCSSIKLSTSQSADYPNAYTIPSQETGTTASGALNNMFAGTGGSFTGTPTINTTYYTSNTIV